MPLSRATTGRNGPELPGSRCPGGAWPERWVSCKPRRRSRRSSSIGETLADKLLIYDALEDEVSEGVASQRSAIARSAAKDPSITDLGGDYQRHLHDLTWPTSLFPKQIVNDIVAHARELRPL